MRFFQNLMKDSGVSLLHGFSSKEKDGVSYESGSFMGFFSAAGLVTAAHNLNPIRSANTIIANYGHADLEFYSYNGNAQKKLIKTKFECLPEKTDICLIDFQLEHTWLKSIQSHPKAEYESIIGQPVIFFEPNQHHVCPLVHQGFISGISFSTFPLREGVHQTVQKLVIDGPIVPGCSGSPLLLCSDLSMIGMIIQERSPYAAIDPAGTKAINEFVSNSLNLNSTRASDGDIIAQQKSATLALFGYIGHVHEVASRGRGYGGYAVTIDEIQQALS